MLRRRGLIPGLAARSISKLTPYRAATTSRVSSFWIVCVKSVADGRGVASEIGGFGGSVTVEVAVSARYGRSVWVAAGVCAETDAEQPTASKATIELNLRNSGLTSGDYTNGL